MPAIQDPQGRLTVLPVVPAEAPPGARRGAKAKAGHKVPSRGNQGTSVGRGGKDG